VRDTGKLSGGARWIGRTLGFTPTRWPAPTFKALAPASDDTCVRPTSYIQAAYERFAPTNLYGPGGSVGFLGWAGAPIGPMLRPRARAIGPGYPAFSRQELTDQRIDMGAFATRAFRRIWAADGPRGDLDPSRADLDVLVWEAPAG
jgi:hypothetical protein